MAVSTQVIRFQKSTGGNGTTQDVTLNFTPKAIIVFSEGNNADNTVSAQYQLSYGFSDGTNNACVTIGSEDAAAAADAGRAHFNNSCFARLSTTAPDSTVLCRGSAAFATNKVTFTWTVNDAVATYITIYAFGGSDITNAFVNTVDIGQTGTGTRSYTGLGFDPVDGDSVLFTLNGDITTTGNLNTATPHASLGIGCAVSTSKRWSINVVSEDTSDPTDTWRVHYTDKCLSALVGSTGVLDYHADFNGWVSDGFSLNITDASPASDCKFSYLVIKGGTWDAGNLNSPTTNTNNVDTTVSVNSNTIRGLMLTAVGGNTANSGTISGTNLISIGATDGTNQATISPVDEDNQANTDNYRVNNTVNIQRLLTTNGTDANVATFDSFPDDSHFRLDWTTTNGSANINQWVVVADGAVSTPVSTTKTHKYNIIGKVTESNTHKYNIIAQVSRTRTHKYNIIAKVTRTSTHKYNIIAKLTPASRTHKYNILQGITESNTHKFSILNTVSRTRTHKYNILEQIVKSAVHVYNIIGKVIQSTTHKYDVIGKITQSTTHLYNIVERVSTDKTHVFSVINHVSTTTTHKFDVLEPVTLETTHLYDVTGKIVVSKTHVYDVIGKITQSTTHKYDITGTCSTSTTHKYNIISAIAAAQRTHKYNIESDTTVTKTTTHKYNILESVSTSKTHLFSILEQVSTLKTHVFSVIEQIISNKTHKFNIIQRIEAQRTHPFSILNAISTVKTHLFDILESISATTTHKYNIIGKLTTNKTHKYNVESATTRVEKTTTHIYDVEAATTPISVEKTHIFDILQQITTTTAHRWAIIAKITKSFTHKYDTISTIGNTATHKYNIIGKLSSIFRTHIFNVLEAIDTKTTTHRYNILNAVGPVTKTHKYNIIGKVTATKTHKYGLGGKVTRTSTHRYRLGEFIFKELGGSTHARIRFPERVRILDILGDINNKAIANIEVFDLGSRNIAIGTIQLADYPFNVLITAETHKPRHRIASSLIIPPIIDTIENQAVCQYIGIQQLEPTSKSNILLVSQLRLQITTPPIQVKSQTQIRQEEKTIIKVSAATVVKENDKVVNTASIMIPPNLNLNKIVIPEIWSLEQEKTLKTIVKLLKTEDLFE